MQLFCFFQKSYTVVLYTILRISYNVWLLCNPWTVSINLDSHFVPICCKLSITKIICLRNQANSRVFVSSISCNKQSLHFGQFAKLNKLSFNGCRASFSGYFLRSAQHNWTYASLTGASRLSDRGLFPPLFLSKFTFINSPRRSCSYLRRYHQHCWRKPWRRGIHYTAVSATTATGPPTTTPSAAFFTTCLILLPLSTA